MCHAARDYRERFTLQIRCLRWRSTETGTQLRLGLVLVLLALLTACGGTAAQAPLRTANPAADRTTQSEQLATAAEPASTAATPATNDAASTSPPAPASARAENSATAGGETRATRLSIFAAASLADAFDEIGRGFEANNPGVSLSFNYGGSNQLAQQIVQGAPVDVFASANQRQMDVVIESGQVVSTTQRTFVRNRLVVVFPADNPAKIRTLNDLAKPGIKLVLAAEAVPVGQYALDFLQKASEAAEFTEAYREMVLANVVSYEENVRAVLSKVELGEADAGIVYTSDISGDAADRVGDLDIPDELNTIAAYPIAAIKESDNAAMAQRFVDYVLSEEVQAVLAGYGFIPGAADE